MSTPEPAPGMDLGTERTIMAADRTLMAWVRTSLSMFSFGFTIYKILDTMAETGALARSDSPRIVALVLAGIGILAIVIGTIEYWYTLAALRQTEKFHLGRPVLIMALIMAICGLALFFGIATRIV